MEPIFKLEVVKVVLFFQGFRNDNSLKETKNAKSNIVFKNFKFLLFLFTLSATIFGCSTTKSDRFGQRLSELRQKIDTVAVVLQQAEDFAKTDGDINLNIASYFADYIEWELKHPEITTDALASNDLWPGQEKLNSDQRDKRYQEHINRELTDAMVLLDQAMQGLEKKATVSSVNPICWSDMVFEDGNFKVDGRVVFPGGFNILDRNLIDSELYPEWTKADEEASKSFLSEMRDMGVGIVGLSVPVTTLIAGYDSIDQAIIRQKLDELDEFGRLGLRADMRLGWGGNEKLLEELWPGITEHSGNGVPIDLDHPGIRELIIKAMSQIVSEVCDHPVVLSWDMANEPFFDMNGWTEHTMAIFHDWLTERHGTIAALNKAWNTNYESFKQIPPPKHKPTQPEYNPGQRTAPPKNKPSQEYSVGEWYDLVTFHNYRVASFFGFVASEIRRYDPDAVIHMKGQDNNSLGPKPFAVTDGIDREMLTTAISLHGVDTRPLPITEPRMAIMIEPDAENAILNYDESLYSFHWLGQSFLYDYLTSLEPNRPIIDLEYHAFSINPIRVPDIDPGHARASLWMAHLHGMVANMVWYWNRRYGPNPFPSEVFKSWFYGSISTQPIVAAEYFRTMNRLNRFSEEVAALAKPLARPIRIFVSKPSYIQNQKHIENLHRAYEASCFHGFPVGFVTEKMLVNSGIPDDSKLIVIPDVQFVSPDALSVLRHAKRAGVQLVRMGRQSITNDDYGFPYPEESIAFLEDIPVLDYASAPYLDRQFGQLIQPLTDQLHVTVQTQNGQNAFGVMSRYANLDGHSILLLVNLRSDEVDVRLINSQGKVHSGYDMLNLEPVKGDEIHLSVKGVRLIKLNE
ncbi:beta-galactosidase [Mangrovibacterium sp.]|uniref:beta-galactosidase n=1 Tax=Mangrovibacterium sp. TaxID=1961364 RepID=UPI0035680D64